jgi:V/A-type H+-transporting ATPase subunit E
MAQDIKNLIEKIQQDGIRGAEEKAREIENQARREVTQILEKARTEAAKLISEAKEEISRGKEEQKTLLAQAARDLLLALHKEISAMLERIILQEVKDALTPEAMYKIIAELIKGSTKEEIVISLSKADLAHLEKEFLRRLKEETKKGVVLKPSEEISGGFIISFDRGKSHFDFSDKALAEYIATYLKPKLAELLKSAVS